MLKRSVRDMNERERKQSSLEKKILNSGLIGSVVLGLVTLAVGLYLYSQALIGLYAHEAYTISHSAAMAIDNVLESNKVADEIMHIYSGLYRQDREKIGTEEYRSFFREVAESKDYQDLIALLASFKGSSKVDDVYLAMYNRTNSNLVMLADPDENPETRMYPGEFEAVSRTERETFLNWNEERNYYVLVNRPDYGGWMVTAGFPIVDVSGNIKSFVLADVTLKNLGTDLAKFSQIYIVILAAAIALFTLRNNRKIRKRLVTPINSIAEAARSYITGRQQGSESRSYFSDLDIRTGDEIENLASTMSSMEKDAKAYLENLTRMTAEKERISTELNLATRIQADMLPNTFPAFPDSCGFDIFASMDPAKEVGGDFYDFFMRDEDHLVMVIGDVSGKGVPAALFMMTARTMLKDAALAGLDPAQILYRVNTQLSESNRNYMFVTVWLGILEVSTGRLVWADAGHEQPAYCSNGKWTLLEKHRGVALAAFEPEILELDEEPAFVNQELSMSPGDAIFQYTDGVTEAMTEAREQFGEEQLIRTLNRAPDRKPQNVLNCVRKKIDQFVQGADQFDDITMLGVEYKGIS